MRFIAWPLPIIWICNNYYIMSTAEKRMMIGWWNTMRLNIQIQWHILNRYLELNLVLHELTFDFNVYILAKMDNSDMTLWFVISCKIKWYCFLRLWLLIVPLHSSIKVTSVVINQDCNSEVIAWVYIPRSYVTYFNVWVILQENRMLNCCMVNIRHLSSLTTYALVLCFNNNVVRIFFTAHMEPFAYRRRKSWDAHFFFEGIGVCANRWKPKDNHSDVIWSWMTTYMMDSIRRTLTKSLSPSGNFDTVVRISIRAARAWVHSNVGITIRSWHHHLW